MDLSFFPKGRYYAKKAKVGIKTPYPPRQSRAFALTISSTTKNEADVWDVNAFRPDPRDDPEFMKSAKSGGLKATVLFESVSYTLSGKCHKIPRYIFIESGKTGKWFVNVR